MTLQEAKTKLKSGYAHDLLATILDGEADVSDPDCLFRTLVLDERWDVDDASELYSQASNLVEAE